MDPLLRDLNEKKQSFRRNVMFLASELKDARCRLATQERSFERETLTRKEIAKRAEDMEEQICGLNKSLEDRDKRLRIAESVSEKHLNELDNLRSQLSSTQEMAKTSFDTAQSAQKHCLQLLEELEKKKTHLEEHDDRVTKLANQLDLLQNERESYRKQFNAEVCRIELERQIMNRINSNGIELIDFPADLEKMTRALIARDEEIAMLREEIRVIIAHWKYKTNDMEHKLEKHVLVDEELKKRVLKLEFCLHVARSQLRKLQRESEKREKMAKERERLAPKQLGMKRSFWECPGFKVALSMSMLLLVVFTRR